MTGMWKQKEIYDGTYNVWDLLDAHEMLDLKEENTARARAALEKD